MKSPNQNLFAPSRLLAWSTSLIGLIAASAPQWAAAQDQKLETVVIESSRNSQLGIAESANTGTVTQQQLQARTVYRAGELLEATPGLIVSQHSGEGKANQFYLRGFNLDHGTDLRTTVDGMIVNQRSHAHGQGWSDLNFLIPELANRLDYKKGPYYAAEGDFAAAGAASIVYADKLEKGIASVGIGQNGFRRTLLADSPAVGNGNLLYALELFRNDGPYTRPDQYRKLNGVLRYSEGTAGNGFNVTAMAYDGNWNATDQIAKRAVDSGQIGRFDAIDGTDGGKAHRYSLSGAWRRSTDLGYTNVNAYLIHHNLDLYSNFTYFLDDPVNGDQFNQRDKRTTSGINASHTVPMPLFGRESDTTVGLQLQNDNSFNGLYSTMARQRLSTTRADHIVESSAGLYIENTTRWGDKFKTVAGLRQDFYRFDVGSDNAVNSGRANDRITSPKLNLIFGPWAKTEYYVNLGSGFHSNDARGTTITVDPKTGAAADRVPALVRAKGAEVGVRSEIIPGLQSSLSVYQLKFDSELLFVGDAGNTEAGRPSRRVGFEFNNYYKPTPWLTIDADIAFARARFNDSDLLGNRIPGAVEGVASLALAVDKLGPWFGAMQFRHFGPRPLTEDNSVRSKGTTTLNGRIGYKISPIMRVELEGFNLTNRRDSAIDYYYESRLANEAPGLSTADIHFHPIESRSFRLTLTANF
ncbi:MAG: TonB-dependent receptor [Herminiimonas sp.]|nr:TonB-dependent receptor [Herminiimonas sp.]